MCLRRCYRAKDGKRHAYWALVKSVRTARGPRQEVVAQWIEPGRETVPRPMMALVLFRLRDPSSELHIAEHASAHSAASDLLGIAPAAANDTRLYRALDKLLPHKAALEKHFKERLGERFNLQYDLLLYDVTSTYFEAQRGYSRDNRADCKQVCIALVVGRCGMPLSNSD